MSLNPTIQIQKIDLFKQALCQQFLVRPLLISADDTENLQERIMVVAKVLSVPEKEAAVISYKMKLEQTFQEESPLTPLMQKIFLQFEAIRKEFFFIGINTLDMFHASLLMKALDKKFIFEKGKERIVLDYLSPAETYEDFVKNITKDISIALVNLSIYFYSKDELTLIEAQKQTKKLLKKLETIDRFLIPGREEELLQWGRDLHDLISLLDLCVHDMGLLPLLLQVANSKETRDCVPSFFKDFISKQKQLLQTFADCVNIYLEQEERQFSLKKGKLETKQKILFEKCKELKRKVLPQISLLISLLEDSRLNTVKKTLTFCSVTELINIQELRGLIEEGTKKLNEMYSSIDLVLTELENDRNDDRATWIPLVCPFGDFVLNSMDTFIITFFSPLQGLHSFQVRIEKCLSLCTIYPIEHCLVTKLDLLQTTNSFLINELKKTLETNDLEKLRESHVRFFTLIRTFLLLRDYSLSTFDTFKSSIKEILGVFETLMQEKSSLMKEFVNTLVETDDSHIPILLLNSYGSQNLFKKTDFQFLTARLKESIESTNFVSFSLESTPDPQVSPFLMPMNETFEKFHQKKAEIALNQKYSDIQQLNILAVELFNIREELDKIPAFYHFVKKIFENQIAPDKELNDLFDIAKKNHLSLQLFDQGNKAFFAYCAETYFDSLTPQKGAITTPPKKIAAARVSSPIEEIETEDVAASAPDIKRFKDHKRDLETLCMKLKSYSLPKCEVNADFLLRQEVAQNTIQNIQCYILQIENLFCAFEEFPYQTAQALFSKLSNLIEQAGNFVAAAKNVQGVINHKHDLLDDLRALGVTIAPIVHVLNGWSSTKYHYSQSDLSTETLGILKDLKSSNIPTLTAKKALEGMMHDAYAFASGLLNSVAHVELQDSLYETPHVTILSQAIMPSLTIDSLLDQINTLVRGTQMSFSAERMSYIAQVSDDEDFDDKRMRMQLISSGCSIIKEALSNLSNLAKPVSSGISYALAENLLVNAALILERTALITLARLNSVGKDSRHIVFSKPKDLNDSRELRSNHDLEKIFGVMNLKVIEERRDIISFFGNTVGGATRYLTQYKMGAALLLEEILFLNVVRKALQEGGLFKEEEHRRLKELFGSSENATPENVDIKLSQLMDIVNDKVARALELTAVLLHHNSSTKVNQCQ